MGFGAYRHLVALESPAGPLDPPTWYAALEPASAAFAEGQAAFTVRGRYHAGITQETRLTFEGRTLQIQSVADTNEQHRELVCFAVEVVARG